MSIELLTLIALWCGQSTPGTVVTVSDDDLRSLLKPKVLVPAITLQDIQTCRIKLMICLKNKKKSEQPSCF